MTALIFVSGITVYKFFRNWGIKPADILSQPLPDKVTLKDEFPANYLIKANTYFELQGRNQCAGYSSAFVLRYLGIEITGKENYDKLDYKLSNGYVLPEGVVSEFKKHGFNSALYKGGTNDLKRQISKGNPVIVIVGEGAQWQHYIMILGYNEDQWFVYDSNKDPVNDNDYNRVMTTAEFEKQWKNGIPLFENVYITALHK